jgi:GT2 family glycosyltransferase
LTATPQVLISILNWNNAALTRRCLLSLQRAGYLADPRFEVVVIDNGSEAVDVAALSECATVLGLRYLRNRKNLGFAAGHNASLREALDRGIDFVWLVNNDALVDAGALEGLLSLMGNDARCAMASPCLAFEDSREIYFAGVIQDWKKLDSVRCPLPWDDEFQAQHADQLWLVGTAILLRSEAVRSVGLLDEALFAYYEDDDYGERLRLGGWRSRVCREVVVWHNLEADNAVLRKRHFYYLTSRNRFFFFRRYTPPAFRRHLMLRLLVQAVNRADVLRGAGHAELADVVLLGAYDGLRKKLGSPDMDRRPALWFRPLVTAGRLVNRVDNRIRGSRSAVSE